MGLLNEQAQNRQKTGPKGGRILPKEKAYTAPCNIFTTKLSCRWNFM